MSTKTDFDPELLRPIERIWEPDLRNMCYVRIDHETGKWIDLDIRDQYEAISQIILHADVPKDILTQFETARNLYLYAWFVYRFYPVAEHQSLTCLEFALRERYKAEAPCKYRSRDGKLYLKGSLRYAVDRGYVKHEGFCRWHKSANTRATYRYEEEKLQEMNAKGLTQIDLDYSEATVTDADRNWDYLNTLLQYLPELRNKYAHGTTQLHNRVLTTLETVSEIINQIYASA